MPKPLDERLNSKQTKGTKFLLKSGSLDKLSFHNLFQCNCFILIYFHKADEIYQDVQRFSLNTFGETTSPLSRKSINCSSVIAFPFLSIPIAPFMSAFKVFPQADLNNPFQIRSEFFRIIDHRYLYTEM